MSSPHDDHDHDDGQTHYYGDGCPDDHGRADHPSGAYYGVHHIQFVVDDRGADLLDKLVDHGPSDHHVDFDDEHDEHYQYDEHDGHSA